MTFWFDMDGTIADFYKVDNWLSKLLANDPSPYIDALPLYNMSLLARYLNKVQKRGYSIGIISWLSKNSNKSYDKKVIDAKINWLKKHLPSVKWNKIHIIKYGTPKSNFKNNPEDILFDDEIENRIEWAGASYEPNQIFQILKAA